MAFAVFALAVVLDFCAAGASLFTDLLQPLIFGQVLGMISKNLTNITSKIWLDNQVYRLFPKN
jgi:hypothetical protein